MLSTTPTTSPGIVVSEIPLYIVEERHTKHFEIIKGGMFLPSSFFSVIIGSSQGVII